MTPSRTMVFTNVAPASDRIARAIPRLLTRLPVA